MAKSTSPVATIYQMTNLVAKIKKNQTAELMYDLLMCINKLVEQNHRVTLQLISGEVHSIALDNRVKLSNADILKLIQDINQVASITPHIYTHTKATVVPSHSQYLN